MTQTDSNRSKLFLASCLSLVSTSVGFAVMGGIMAPLKSQFILSNAQVGAISGIGILGFTLAIFALGPLVDLLGMSRLMRFAALCHIGGVITMITAKGYTGLYAGALILSLGNGTVEAVCNPLVATLYRDDKTTWLNRFHVWFPGGIVIGAVLCTLIGRIDLGTNPAFQHWQLMLCLIIAPTIAYSLLFTGRDFPKTERVEAGLSFGQMLAGAFSRPLFWILALCMCITATLELGPNRWMSAVLASGGIDGLLVLAYISGIMALLRFFAGGLIHKLAPTGVIIAGAILGGLGLYLFSYASSNTMAFGAATLFAVGVAFFWPTMIGFTAERLPRSGALGLALMGGIGMLAVSHVIPVMGKQADHYLHENLDKKAAREAIAAAAAAWPKLAEGQNEVFKKEILQAASDAESVLKEAELPELKTAAAMQGLIKNAPPGEKTAKVKENGIAADKLTAQLKAVLNPADNKGGLMSFRLLAPFAGLLVLIFGTIWFLDRRNGGYKAEQIQH
ncbi:MAG: hypothetical protein RL095_25 [Verrucomicrobiota bacterium]|jgi:hypothetical protein